MSDHDEMLAMLTMNMIEHIGRVQMFKGGHIDVHPDVANDRIEREIALANMYSQALLALRP